MVLLVVAGGCQDETGAPPDQRNFQRVSTKKVDVLFMLDNSPGTSSKQNELKARFPELIKIIDSFGRVNPAWYHIGVVTSDMGAGQFTLGGGQCHPGGDRGKLRAIGKSADVTCQAPTGDVNFIDYNQIDGTNNLPTGQDLATSFGCMASVGVTGCGFEAPLESVYRALHDPPPENHDFLRSDALLVVMWLTDEDDCSADPDTDLFDPSATQYGALQSYRCTNYSIACGDPPMLMPYGDSGGNLAASMPCQDADPSVNKLIPVSKYIDFFTKPASQGGIKADPHDVILAGISAPTNDVESKALNPSVFPPAPCTGPIDGMHCVVVLQPSCTAPQNTQFYGDPAVRLRQVIDSAVNKQETSVCDTSYQSAMQSFGALIVSNIGGSCVTSPLADPNNPVCVVQDVISNSDGSTTIDELPSCEKNGGTTPCWKIEARDPAECAPVCANDGDPGQHFGLTIDRGPRGQPPASSKTRFSCPTVTVAKDVRTGLFPACGAPL
jgi:hypothetical protein